MIWGFLKSPLPHIQKHEFERIEQDYGEEGKVLYDLKSPQTDWNKKVILIIPGVTGCSNDRYI